MKGKNGESATDVVESLGRALTDILASKPKLEAAEDDDFGLIEARRDALRSWDEALELYTIVDRDAWSKEDVEAVEAEFGRVHTLISPFDDADLEAPRIEKRNVIIDGDEILVQRVPKAKEESCCFTRIGFRNTTSYPIEIRVSGRDGEQESARLRRRQTKRVRKIDGRKRTIPGGLGRCVTIEARARYPFGWGEFHSLRLCCDEEPLPQVGEELQLRRPVNERHSTRFGGIVLTELTILQPCPETDSGESTTAGGQALSGITGIPGLDVDGDRHYGAHTVMRFIPTNCRALAFVQGVKRKTTVQRPGATEHRDMPGMSTPGDQLKLDIRRGDRTPAYPHTKPLPNGGLEMRDYPGVENPWGRFDLDGVRHRLPPGTEMIVRWTFRTWVVCLAPAPVHVLGRFDWTVKLTLTIGRGAGDTNGRIEGTRPQFNDDPDLDNYRRVVREAPRPAGFLPP